MTGAPAGVFVLVEATTKPGKLADAVAWWRANLPDTRAKEGCRFAEIYVDRDDPDRAIVFEHWDTREQHEEYARWRREQPGRAEFVELLSGPFVVRYFDREEL